MTYPAAYALGLLAPWLLLLAFGAQDTPAVGYAGELAVVGAAVIGVYAVAVRRSGWRPEPGDSARYLCCVANGALILLPMMLVWPAALLEGRLPSDLLVPSLRAAFGVGIGALALSLGAELAPRLRRRRGHLGGVG